MSDEDKDRVSYNDPSKANDGEGPIYYLQKLSNSDKMFAMNEFLEFLDNLELMTWEEAMEWFEPIDNKGWYKDIGGFEMMQVKARRRN
jgi:hypothetical protein